MVLALDNPHKTTRKGGISEDGKKLQPIRFDNGEPVYRFRVECIPAGKFLTADEQPFEVTQPTLEHWEQTFKAFANRGIPVPVLTGSHLEPTAEHSVGQVVGVDVKNGSLWATVEMIGKDVPRLAATNSVSIYAEPEWTDAKGNKYQWPLRHLLMTPDPRIPGMEGFTPLAASNGKVFNIPILRFLKLDNVGPDTVQSVQGQKAAERRNSGQLARFRQNIEQKTAGDEPMAPKSKITHIALDELGSQNEAGLGVPGVGDGGMLPGGPGDQGSTAGDVNASAPESKESLKQQIKRHFTDHAHTVLEDDQMEHTEKLEAMKELLVECEKILEAFTDEEEQEPENQEEEPENEEVEEDQDQGEEPEHEEGARGAAMSNDSEDGPDQILGIGKDIAGMAAKAAPAVAACLNNMPQMRQALGPRDAQLAQLTSRLRRQEIQALWLSGKISPVQKKQLEDQFLAPQHVALSLSNENFGNSFDQAISLLASNESYGEQTGIQGGQNGEPIAGIALTNRYAQNQQEIAQAEKDEADFIKPSSQRVSKNGKK